MSPDIIISVFQVSNLVLVRMLDIELYF